MVSPYSIPVSLKFAAALVAAATILAAGCGSDSSDSTETGATGSQSTTQKETPLGPAKPKESISEAQSRIAETVSSGDCKKIAALYPLSQAGTNSDARCENLKRRLAGATVLGAKSYGAGAGAGVIDYKQRALTISAPLLRDQDGLFHIVFIDPFLGEVSTETKLDKGFDAAVNDAVGALAATDCDAFADLAYRRYGPGALGDEVLCEYVDRNAIKRILEQLPDLTPELFGGNANYAFYGFGYPGAQYTIVMARQSDSKLPKGIDPLPPGAEQLAYVNLYLTNTAARSGAGK